LPINISTKGKTTIYTFKDYSAKFIEIKKPTKESMGFCDVKLLIKNTPAWTFHYFYSPTDCRVDNLLATNPSKNGSKQAAMELDFLMHCVEKHLFSKGVTLQKVRTHKGFARFLSRRGWTVKNKSPTTFDMEKILKKRNNPAPSIMGGKWKAKRALAIRRIR